MQSKGDKELLEIAQQERNECVSEMEALEQNVLDMLLPIQPADSFDIILEVSVR